MKILTLCNGGICRSVAMAGTLKYELGKDAIAASLDKNSDETLALLMGWAERVVVMERSLLAKIPDQFRPKVVLANVGHDRWENPMDPDILRIVTGKARGWAAAGYPAGGEI